MKPVQANIGKWYIECIPQDGARISVLRFEGKDLLTTKPHVFKAPDNSYGEYENRPVFGYDETVPFLHVMHALLPLNEIQYFKLPEFGRIENERDSNVLDVKDANSTSDYLQAIPSGEYAMILLKEIDAGSVNIGYQNGLQLNMSFDRKLFPTLGVWWNNSAYPEEKVLERNECAFEPIPGVCSDLSKSFKEGVYMNVEAGKSTSWIIKWEIPDRIN